MKRFLILFSSVFFIFPLYAKTKALLIGVEIYQDSQINTANTSTHTVNELLNVFIDGEMRINPQDIKKITFKKATQKNIMAAGTCFFTDLTAQDQVLVFYCGHAKIFNDTKGKPYLWLTSYDCNLKTPSSGIPANNFIRSICHHTKATNITIVMEACHSGMIIKQIAKFKQEFPSKKLNFFASCQFNQTSMESFALRLPYFSNFFILGLKGLADNNHDSKITLQELNNYIFKQVTSQKCEFAMDKRDITDEYVQKFFIERHKDINGNGKMEIKEIQAAIPQINQEIPTLYLEYEKINRQIRIVYSCSEPLGQTPVCHLDTPKMIIARKYNIWEK